MSARTYPNSNYSKRQSANIPKGFIDTGLVVELPLSVYNEELACDRKMHLTTPLIPIYEIGRPLDNRICCPYARRNDAIAATTCEWATDPERTGCKLGDGRPCLFDEPNDSKMWQWVREQAEIQRQVESEAK